MKNYLNKPAVRAAIIALVAIVILWSGYSFWRARADLKPTYIEHTVTREDIEELVLSTGTVQPENRVDIRSPINGRMEKVLVREGDRVKAGQIVAWISSVERAALLDAARAEGSDAVAYWETLYKPTPVIAPLDGTIIQRNIEPGQSFENTYQILVEANRLVVEGQVDETDIAQIKVGMPVEIRLDAYSKNPIPAKVLHIAFDSKVVNNVTTYVVDVLPEKEPDFMRSGMTANLKFYIDRKSGVLTIPAEAFRTLDGGRTVVQVRGPEDTVREKEVKLGLTDGKRVEVVSGLAENDVVLTLEVKRKERANRGGSPFSPMGGGRPRKTSSAGSGGDSTSGATSDAGD